MDKKTTGGNLLLLLASLIWGLAFVAQRVGLDYVGPFTMNAVRSLLGGAVLLAMVPLLDRSAGRRPSLWGTDDPAARRSLVLGGLACGLALAVATALQQVGLLYTTVGKAGFITTFYIVLVPLFGIVLGQRFSARGWLCVALALAGLYLLCVGDGFALGRGDLLVLGCAAVFAVHILLIAHFSKKVDAVRLSCLQFLVSGIVNMIPMMVLEQPKASAILAAWLPIVYAGVLSSAVAYTLQILGQRHVPAAVASLIMSLESVFAVLGGWLILGQTMTARELSGCGLLFAAVVLIQFSDRKARAPAAPLADPAQIE